jgi:hypothetical protein
MLMINLLQAFYLDIHSDFSFGVNYYNLEETRYIKTPYVFKLNPEVVVNDNLSFFFTFIHTPSELESNISFLPRIQEAYTLINTETGIYKIGLFKKSFGLKSLVSDSNSYFANNASRPSLFVGFEGSFNLLSSVSLNPFVSTIVNKQNYKLDNNSFEAGFDVFYKHEAQRLSLGVFFSYLSHKNVSSTNPFSTFSNLVQFEQKSFNLKKIIFFGKKKWHKIHTSFEIPIMLGTHSTLMTSTSSNNIQTFALLSETDFLVLPTLTLNLYLGYVPGQNSSSKINGMILHEHFQLSPLLSVSNNKIFTRFQGTLNYDKWFFTLGSLIAFHATKGDENTSHFIQTGKTFDITDKSLTDSFYGAEIFSRIKYEVLSQFFIETFISYAFMGKDHPSSKNPFSLGLITSLKF